MSLTFKAKSFLRNRRWKKYWDAQDSRNHIEFYRAMSQEWKTDRAGR